MELSVLT